MLNTKKLTRPFLILGFLALLSCKGSVFDGDSIPVLGDLTVLDAGGSSITLQQPNVSNSDDKNAIILAYIGLDGVISVTGSVVTNFIQGPIDVSAGPHEFTGLEPNKTYRIIVIAENAIGSSVKQITQETSSNSGNTVAPILGEFVITEVAEHFISFSPAIPGVLTGHPEDIVQAYIGIDGIISVSDSIVSNYIQGPIDVNAGLNFFQNLNGYVTYRIIIVAQNSLGSFVRQIVQITDGEAYVLADLVINSVNPSSITVSAGFVNTGIPAATITAYIGVDGTISVNGSSVTNYLQQGTIDASWGSYQFSNLATDTMYRIIVVAENPVGYSVKQITQSTAVRAPVISSLDIYEPSSTMITYENTIFSTQGSPTPTIQAYIGLDGVISVTGNVVSNFVEGPIDVFGIAYIFRHLTPNTNYRFIVVAENAIGYSVKQAVKHTGICTVVAFPDQALEAIIRNYINQGTGPICQDELLNITELSDASQPPDYIYDLTGLGQCTNLQSLTLGERLFPYGGSIDLTPLASLTTLSTLSLSGPAITNIAPLVSLTNLSNIYISGTPLGDAGFSSISGFNSLSYLDLQNNQITDIDLYIYNIIDAGTNVVLNGNPLSPTAISELCNFLVQGKSVTFDGQDSCP
jgi:hypothetical protein